MLFLLALAALALADPSIPNWGGNETTFQFMAMINLTDPSEHPEQPYWQFHYFYDATVEASRYDHLVGQKDEVCAGVTLPGGGSSWGQPCTVKFTGKAYDGFIYLEFPSIQYCCKCTNAFGAVRYDWLYEDSSYTGPTSVRDYKVDSWLKYGASDNHYYATADSLQLPVRYAEHKNGVLKQWDFLLETYSSQPLPRSIFQPKSSCTEKCDSRVCRM